MRHVLTLIVFVVCCVSSLAAAQANDEMLAELRGRLDEFEKRQGEHDAQALAKLYSKDCDVNHDGNQMNGRDEVMASWKQSFEDNPEAKFDYDRDKISWKIIDSETAVESGQWQDSNKRVAGLPTSGNYTCVYKRIDGELLIVHERAWADPTAPLSTGTLAPANPVMPADVRQQLDRIVGDWVFEVKDGDALDAIQQVSVRWADGNHCIEYEGSGVGFNTGTPFQAKGIVGYDAFENMAIERNYSSDGENMSATFDFSEPDHWSSEVERVLFDEDGQVTKETTQRQFNWNGDDQFDLVVETKDEDGKPKKLTLQCRRKLVSMPENVAKILDTFSGTWDSEITIGQRTEKGVFTAKWQPGRNVMVCQEASEDGKTRIDFILAWDKESQRLAEKGYTSTGAKWEAYWNTATDGKWTAVDIAGVDGKVVRSLTEMTYGDGKAKYRGSWKGKPLVIVRTKKD